MTPQEFKAWFDGYTEAIGDVPNKKQWARIKERVAEIDGRPVTERVFVDRYIRPYWHGPVLYPSFPWYSTSMGNLSSGTYQSNLSANDLQGQACNNGNMQQYNSLLAMNALGRSEAAA